MKTLSDLTIDTSDIERLLGDLDKAARGVCGSEYGLPLWGGDKSQLILIVLQWVASLQEAAEVTK